MATKFGEQPVRQEMARQRWRPSDVARELGIDVTHIKNAVKGACRPRPELRKGLARLLGKKSRELWTEEVLSKPYDPKRNPWGARQGIDR